MARTQNQRTFDKALQLKDVAAVTASGAGQVGGSAKVVDVGPGRFDATALVDVSALKVSAGDESYDISIQGSNSSTFAAGVVNLGTMKAGHSSKTGESASSVVGRYELPVTNERNGTLYRYLRVYHSIAGTTPTITYAAHLQQTGAM